VAGLLLATAATKKHVHGARSSGGREGQGRAGQGSTWRSALGRSWQHLQKDPFTSITVIDEWFPCRFSIKKWASDLRLPF